jgi:hypothetical protein
MRHHTTTPSAKWIASEVVSILKKTPDMGVREMQIKLQDDHKCIIGYDTVWDGLESCRMITSVLLAMTQFGMEWKGYEDNVWQLGREF